MLIDTRSGTGISGGILTVADGWRRPMFYVSVEDLDAALDRVQQAGGATTLPPLTEFVTFAQFTDPDGNLVGLLKRGDEAPVSLGDAPPVSRFHLSSTNPAALVEFYRTVLGWRTGALGSGHAPAFEVETGARGIPGTIGGASPGAAPTTFYASVPEVDAYAVRARELGSVVENPQTGRLGDHRAAYVVDPEGQTFGLLGPG